MEIFAMVACVAAAVGLLAIAYDLGAETPAYLRWPLVGVAIIFFGVFLATLKHPGHYSDYTDIGFTGMAVLTIVTVAYLVSRKHITPGVIKIAGLSLAIMYATWGVASCIGKSKPQTVNTSINRDSLSVPPSVQEQRDMDAWNQWNKRTQK